MSRSTFHRYIAVDWSAKSVPSSNKPSADAIWVGKKTCKDEETREFYFRTRFECEKFLANELCDAVDCGERVLIGYDFDFGFPTGFASSLGYVGNLPWKFIWDKISNMIEDDTTNRNNRFEVAASINKEIAGSDTNGPLWGCPAGQSYDGLFPKSPAYPFKSTNGILLGRRRVCEKRESQAQPVWKLIGSASVGGQSLVGIPVINRLRHVEKLVDLSRIWPFETGFDSKVLFDGSARVVHVEIWPGLLSSILDKSCVVRDQAQVRATVNWLFETDKAKRLAWLFTPPNWLTNLELTAAAMEEGWVIGAGHNREIFSPNSIEEQQSFNL
jgi:hypothetical protein